MSTFVKTLSYSDVERSKSFYGEKMNASDYAQFYGCKVTYLNGELCGAYWLDELYYGAETYMVDKFGRLNHELASQDDVGVCPGLDTALKPFLSLKSQFGEFPQTKVNDQLFELVLRYGKVTGEKYPARTDGFESIEYIYKGEKYVVGEYANKVACFKVEPITFTVSESGVIRAKNILMTGPFSEEKNYLELSYSGSLLEKTIKIFEKASGIERLIKMGWYEAKREEFSKHMKEEYKKYKRGNKLNKANFNKSILSKENNIEKTL